MSQMQVVQKERVRREWFIVKDTVTGFIDFIFGENEIEAIVRSAYNGYINDENTRFKIDGISTYIPYEKKSVALIDENGQYVFLKGEVAKDIRKQILDGKSVVTFTHNNKLYKNCIIEIYAFKIICLGNLTPVTEPLTEQVDPGGYYTELPVYLREIYFVDTILDKNKPHKLYIPKDSTISRTIRNHFLTADEEESIVITSPINEDFSCECELISSPLQIKCISTNILSQGKWDISTL